MSSFPALTTQHFVRVSAGGSDVVRLTAFGTLAHRQTSTTFEPLSTYRQVPLWRSAIGRGSLRLTRVDVVVDVGVCFVSVAVLGETDSTECEICVVVDEFDVDFVARFLHFHIDVRPSIWIGSTLRRQYAAHRDGWGQGFRLPQ